MTNLITKLKSALSNVVLIAAAIFMAGLCFAFIGALALFGLMAVGVALIAAPFVTPLVLGSDYAEAAAQ